MQFASKNVLLMILVAFFLFVIGYNILGNNMVRERSSQQLSLENTFGVRLSLGGLEGFSEGATDNSKFTAQNITDIIKCADPNGSKSPYSSSDISDMLSGSSFTISNGKVTCSSDKKSDSKSDSKNDSSSSGSKKSSDSSSDSKSDSTDSKSK